jgi:hypothetical protein
MVGYKIVLYDTTYPNGTHVTPATLMGYIASPESLGDAYPSLGGTYCKKRTRLNNTPTRAHNPKGVLFRNFSHVFIGSEASVFNTLATGFWTRFEEHASPTSPIS